MEILAKYKFADWLYNRFVENYKNQNIVEAFHLLGYSFTYSNLQWKSETFRSAKTYKRTVQGY
jgi:hypothetical protein